MNLHHLVKKYCQKSHYKRSKQDHKNVYFAALEKNPDSVIVRGSKDFTFTQINWTRTQVSVQFISSVFQCNLAARHPARNRQILQEKVPQELHVDKTE